MSEHTEFMSKMRYINEMMGLSCFPDFLEMRIFPDGKEITESMAVYNFIRNKQDWFELGDPDVTIIAVGDGCTPRTASMFAFRSAWNAYSVDPNLKWKNMNRVKRLTCLREKVEDLKPFHFKKLVIACVHSHARLEDCVERFTADERIVISMPCCVKQVREREPDFQYVDDGVWSPKNDILVWFDN